VGSEAGTTADVEFREARVDAGEGARLLAAMRGEIARLYEGLDLDAETMPKAGPAELGPPRGAFIVGWRDGAAVCCGGIKDLGGEACEIKRMYVAPQARRSGVARALLRALEDRARELGYALARLDTGPRQPHARHLYESAGYREIGNFNGNPVATFFAEKPLR
jgi:GNAT superfamily N-acetyltransferase